MEKILRSIILLIHICLISYGQTTSQNLEYDLKQQISTGLSQNLSLIGTGGLNISVDENEYIVDAGDVFLVKIDVKGPALNIFQTVVTPDGKIVLPNAPSLTVAGLNLKEAKSNVYKALKESVTDADIEVHLFQLHPVRVTIIGAVYKEGRQELFSSSRLFDALQFALQIPLELQKQQDIQLQKDPNAWVNEKRNNLFFTSDSKHVDIISKISWRKIEVIRKDQSYFYDLLRFKNLGDLSQNPYIMNEDIIRVHYIDQSQNIIEVSGAVGNPTQFEFREGDDLQSALSFAGGLLPFADSSRIELYRFQVNQYSLEKIILNFNADAGFKLHPDDRISVRVKTSFRPKFSVDIIGEVRFPGKYPIMEGSTSLKEIIKKAGGFTGDASLTLSKVVRRKYSKEDFELKRLVTVQPTQMTVIEWSYFQAGSKEDLYVVNADFAKIFDSPHETDDIGLRDLDVIVIPRKSNLVYISGAVVTPGIYEYRPGWSVNEYINAANGFARRARESEMRVVKEKTGNWLDINMKYIPEEGDKIFVPVKFERSNWDYFKEGLTVLTQFAAIAAVIISLNNL